MLFKDLLKQWRGSRLQKEAADLLDIPLGTYRKWEYGKRTPTKITLAQVEQRMAAHPDTPHECNQYCQRTEAHS